MVQATHLGGKPWMVSFSGMAQVMGWPQRPPLVAMYDRPRVLRSWAAFCNGHVPEQRLVPFADVRNMSPEAFVHLLAEDFQVCMQLDMHRWRYCLHAPAQLPAGAPLFAVLQGANAGAEAMTQDARCACLLASQVTG